MMLPVRVPFRWEVGHHTAETTPDRYVSARVPGAVQLDWATAEGWEPYWKGENYKQYRWMEDTYWTYRTTLPKSPARDGQRAFLVLEGVDYQFDILLAGKPIFSQEGMFIAVRLELTQQYQSGQELCIRVHPAPKSQPSPEDRAQANRSCKPAVSYGWDFHPRLIPLGIWQDAYLEVTPATYLANAELHYTLSDRFDRADLHLHLRLDGQAPATAQWKLLSPTGQEVLASSADLQPGDNTIHAILNSPTLWWPHDHGTPALYAFQVTLGEQTITKRIGFRRARLVMHEGAWKWPNAFPKGPSNPPITLEVNGRRIFAKGSNWVSPDIFPGILCKERYQPLLEAAKNANLNILRMWGGAPAQKQAFYDLCDEMGLMVWQEFPLGCNCYPDEPHYLATLDQESRSLIQRLRQHPSVVLFCGGNELFNSWSGMTEQSLPLRLLDRNCFELAPDRPFLKTSPIMGMGHGSYGFAAVNPEDNTHGFLQEDHECWHIFQHSSCTAYTEFGCGGASPVELLTETRSEDIRRWLWTGTEGVRPPEGECLHMPPTLPARYFGPNTSLEQWVERSQWLQAEGYRGIFEEARRQKPKAAMAINWCFNEPWPNIINLSIIAYPVRPKRAVGAITQACRPVLASARIPHFQWKKNELFEAELWLLSDKYEVQPAGQMKASLIVGDQVTPLITWDFAQVAENTNLRGPKVQYKLPEIAADSFVLRLEVVGRPELASEYQLSFKR